VNESITGNDYGLDANRESFTGRPIEVAVGQENCLSRGYRLGGLSGKLQKGPGPMIVGLQFRLFMCPLSLFHYVFLHLSSHLCFESCLCSYVRLCAVLSPF
jgi:hypothetical protein